MLPRPALLPLVLRDGPTNAQSAESSLRPSSQDQGGGNILRWTVSPIRSKFLSTSMSYPLPRPAAASATLS